MIRIKSKKSGHLYVINLANIEFYEVGVYDRDENNAESYYVEFYLKARMLRFIVGAGLYASRNALECDLEFHKGTILVSEEV